MNNILRFKYVNLTEQVHIQHCWQCPIFRPPSKMLNLLIFLSVFVPCSSMYASVVDHKFNQPIESNNCDNYYTQIDAEDTASWPDQSASRLELRWYLDCIWKCRQVFTWISLRFKFFPYSRCLQRILLDDRKNNSWWGMWKL